MVALTRGRTPGVPGQDLPAGNGTSTAIERRRQHVVEAEPGPRPGRLDPSALGVDRLASARVVVSTPLDLVGHHGLPLVVGQPGQATSTAVTPGRRLLD